MFDLEGFLSELSACQAETEPRRVASEVVRRALTTPGEVCDAIAPSEGGINLLLHSPELTVINVAWAPKMRLMPHDHRMWAVIGIYDGTEDNQFYRRASTGELVSTSGRQLNTGDIAVLGSETIHSVSNPSAGLTGAVHVYGGDFVNRPRSQWGPGDLVERPYDMNEVNRQFHEANVAAGLPKRS